MKSESSASRRRLSTASIMLAIMLIAIIPQIPDSNILTPVHAQLDTGFATISPARYWGPFLRSSGDVQVGVNRTGIAVRVEIPKEFLDGVVSGENDTHFIESDIRNDYYYYSVVNERNHWTYGWRGNVTNGPCFKPDFAYYDSNAPYCVEIWNFLNNRYLNFTPPKFIRFKGLNSPRLAGTYNFTVFVANQTNKFGYPDFVHAWNETLFVPISMSGNPSSITGHICSDPYHTLQCNGATITNTKGVVYATDTGTDQVVARAYVRSDGSFNLTGLASGTTSSAIYRLSASAGFDAAKGVAYSLTEGPEVGLSNGQPGSGDVPLWPAPQVCGDIMYYKSGTPTALARPVTSRLISAGIRLLNVTVEATLLSQGYVFRYQKVSRNNTDDPFTIVTGLGRKYVGADPYGTEFAGLPQPGEFGSSTYNMLVKVNVTGYTHSQPFTVTVSSDSDPTGSLLCTNRVDQGPMKLFEGGIISGNIEFFDVPRSANGMTPRMSEQGLFGTTTGALFGGNIVIEAVGSDGSTKGVEIINGTLPDGTTSYADKIMIPFAIVGFSEYYNRTWQGWWGQPDCGLAPDPGYKLSVFIRGYSQSNANQTYTLGLSQDYGPITLSMIRAGSMLIQVTSYNNRFGSRAVQSQKPFRFLNLTIPVRARVYFYPTTTPIQYSDVTGGSDGYVERILVQGVNGVGVSSFKAIFTGLNWDIRDITWVLGRLPTYLPDDTYNVKAFTLGYVQQGPISATIGQASPAPAKVDLLIGNEIDLTSPLYIDEQSFLKHGIPEHDHVVAEATTNASDVGCVTGDEAGLTAAVMANLTAGIPTLSFALFGFGGTIVNNTFNGQGHFYYVAPSGRSCADYGLDVGNYSAHYHPREQSSGEFGFNTHFVQSGTSPIVTFSDLDQENGVFLDMFQMGKVTQGVDMGTGRPNFVSGQVQGQLPVPLSWVEIRAENGLIVRSVTTLDGVYQGVGALFLPEGTYTITFIDVSGYYQPQNGTITVGWGGETAASALLCPTYYKVIHQVCIGPSQSPPSTTSDEFASSIGPLGLLCSVCIVLEKPGKMQSFL